MGHFKPERTRRPTGNRRSFIRKGRKPVHPAPPSQPPNPRVNREAKRLLEHIGKPEPSPFRPDPFQLEALEKLRTQDVVVSAPTGSGKTWIAVQATKEYLSRRGCIWYATPLKALSNAKYEEFGEVFGREQVGILTGDRKENADAPVIVGTTEILRNQLYDAMHEGADLGVDLVILDEAHYLGDPDRGVVWEEVLIYLSSRVRILLLSATISNAFQLAQWLTHIRNVPCTVVHSAVRPVPLHVLFMTADAELTPFLRGTRLFPRVATFADMRRKKRRFTEETAPDLNLIVETLREFDLLPAIIFLKSRSECDRALEELNPSPHPPDEGGFADAVRRQLEPYPELQTQRQLKALFQCRAGSHHAGQLPAWRLCIEKLMAEGHLDLIFSTSTVAAGVNFPARTVAIMQSDRFNGQSFVDLTATDFHQMTGRAGRRGMDNAGFTLIVPGKFVDVLLVKELLLSEPEPLQSRVTINSSMTLNLLLSHDPKGVADLLRLTFAGFHENPRQASKVHQRLVHEFRRHLNLLQELNYVDEQGNPTYDGTWAARLRLDHPLLIAELIREGAFDHLGPAELAALVAPFVMDKDKEIVISRELWDACAPVWKRFRQMMRQLKPISGLMISRGFEVPAVMFWPATAVYIWAHEVEWNKLTLHVDADEGDLAMLISRTADHLRQLVSLEKEQPELADTARRAMQLLLRSPLI